MDRREWKDPETFQPERWIDDEGKFFIASRSFLPFSTGRRVCVGESLAKAELLIFLVAIFQRFTFSEPPGVKLTHEMGDLAFGPIPKPFNVIVNPRTQEE